jgi:hypothetical protein
MQIRAQFVLIQGPRMALAVFLHQFSAFLRMMNADPSAVCAHPRTQNGIGGVFSAPILRILEDDECRSEDSLCSSKDPEWHWLCFCTNSQNS